MVTSLTLSILATRGAGLATTVLEDQPVKSLPAKPVPVPVNQPPSRTIQVPLPPPNKTNTNQPVPVTPAPVKK
jgi:hypothetical protein